MNAFTAHPLHDPRLRHFHAWRDDLAGASPLRQRFEEWVFLNGAAVLLAEKTGELLTLSYDEFPMDTATVEAGLRRLSRILKFDYRLLDGGERSLKFIIYQEDRLQAVLDEAPYCVMVEQLGYRYPLLAAGFIEEVRERWQRHNEVPHEIGVALGYPLDDVFGYMGLLPLPCKGACGWQVYGCLRESKRRSCAFSDARCRALVFLASAAAVA
ncbi:MAG: DUF3793 family protein [Opitutales bacterium]